MKKIILAFAIVMTSLLSFNIVAANNETKNCPKKENCQKQKNCSSVQKDCSTSCLFNGITLTETQKNEIKALTKDLKCGNCTKDTKTCPLAAQEKYNAGIKKILTSVQYNKFLENKSKVQQSGNCAKATNCNAEQQNCNKKKCNK